jgi:Protein of unknown function (DUF2924)
MRSREPGVTSTPNEPPDLAEQFAALVQANEAQLRTEWRLVYRKPPPLLSRDLMIRSLAYTLQQRVHGGLSRAVKRKLTTLAGALQQKNGNAMAVPSLRLKAGAKLVREWHGQTHTVLVQADGFAYGGCSYASLSQIARAITRVQWSGPRFFGLTCRKPASTPKAD